MARLEFDRMRITLLSAVALIAAGCSPIRPGPVQISQCAIHAVPVRNQHAVVYRFYLTNETDRFVSAVRIGSNDWEHHAALFPPDSLVYDDYRALSPHASHFVYLHTDPLPALVIAQRLHVPRTRLSEWQPLSCMTESVWFADGSAWVAKGPPGGAYVLPRYRNSSESHKSSYSI